MDCYHIWRPTAPQVPVLISAPHVGTAFPEGMEPPIRQAFRDCPIDTDWCVHELYDFAPAMGITVIHSHFSRYVVDLNRDPSGAKLYDDERAETNVVASHSFGGEALYDREVTLAEIASRIESFHKPYHEAVARELKALKEKFGVALLYEAHSIKREVPSIRASAFPDLMLGTNRGSSASPHIVEAAKQVLQASPYSWQLDDPFAGGFLTRSFGRPADGIHALQLERCWDLYVDEDRYCLDENRAKKIRPMLHSLLVCLGKALSN